MCLKLVFRQLYQELSGLAIDLRYLIFCGRATDPWAKPEVSSSSCMHFLQKLSASQLEHTRRFVAKDIVVTRRSYREYRLHYVAIRGLIEF